MRKLEIILGFFSLAAIVLTVLSVTGGNLLTIFVLSALSLVYMIFGFAIITGFGLRNAFKKKTYENIRMWRVVGAVALGWGLGSIIIGILFKVMLWPGADKMLANGLFSGIIALPIIVVKLIQTKAPFYKINLIRLLVIAGIGTVWYSISTNAYLEYKFGDYPEYVEAYKAHHADPKNKEVYKQFIDAREKMLEQRYQK